MAEESFLLVSLKEDKAKKLAQVLSNDTSRKILDYLSENKKATATELSKKILLPLSTVHYNLQHLVEAKLVNADEYTYSKKGKEIIHYTLSNKFVIIAPKHIEGLKEKLSGFLPVFLVVSAISIAIKFLRKVPKNAALFVENMPSAADDAAGMARDVVPEVIEIQAKSFGASQSIAPPSFDPALWFFIGAVTCLIVFLLFKVFKRKRKT